jgi:hypothetical protein
MRTNGEEAGRNRGLGWVALVLGVIGGAFAFCGLGYALSTFADPADSAQPITFPLFFISGIWIPLSESTS